jgi:hypothetical protein
MRFIGLLTSSLLLLLIHNSFGSENSLITNQDIILKNIDVNIKGTYCGTVGKRFVFKSLFVKATDRSIKSIMEFSCLSTDSCTLEEIKIKNNKITVGLFNPARWKHTVHKVKHNTKEIVYSIGPRNQISYNMKNKILKVLTLSSLNKKVMDIYESHIECSIGK